MPATKMQNSNTASGPKDAVEERILNRLTGLENKIRFQHTRLKDATNKAVTVDGKTRHSFANIAAARREEITGLEVRAEQAKHALAEAEKDAPRRARLRERAEKIQSEREAAQKKVAALRKQADQLEENDKQLEARFKRVRLLAEKIPSELKNVGVVNVEPEDI